MKTLKKLGLFLGVLVVGLAAFSSCKSDDNTVIVEDGFYVTGAATGSTSLSIVDRMSTGLNEVSKEKRAGMYEKYIALEANKEFYLVLKEGSVETRYSAVLTDFDTKGENDQPTVILHRGTLVSGSSAVAMKVTTSGLYHIVLDLNTAKDLANPLIIVAPVQWGVRGVNGDWGWKKMKAGAFNRTTMVWDTTIAATSASEFKFAYGGGWKIQLDDAGLVKANTNLGVDMLPNGANLNMPKGTDIKVTLTWNLATGEISKSYAMAITGNIIIEDPKTFVVGLSGNAFGSNTTPPAEWSDPSGATLAVYDAANSTVTDATTKAGTYIYNISNLKVDATKEFKVRVNGGWIGVSGATIVGETFGGTDNFIVNTAATYTKVRFEVVWNGSKATSIKLTFTK